MTSLEKFWLKVDKSAGPKACWPWRGTVSYRGYGNWYVGCTTRVASAVALELASGEKANGRIALHSCDNPPCCNPEHLRWGTHKDNAQDRREREQYRGQARGVDHGQARLTPELVIEIRRRYVPHNVVNGQRAMAREFGIGQKTISDMLAGRNWRHV